MSNIGLWKLHQDSGLRSLSKTLQLQHRKAEHGYKGGCNWQRPALCLENRDWEPGRSSIETMDKSTQQRGVGGQISETLSSTVVLGSNLQTVLRIDGCYYGVFRALFSSTESPREGKGTMREMRQVMAGTPQDEPPHSSGPLCAHEWRGECMARCLRFLPILRLTIHKEIILQLSSYFQNIKFM